MHRSNPDEAYQLLSQAVEGGRVGIWYWDIDNNQYEWSGLCRQLLGLPAEKPPSIEHLYSVLHADDLDRIKQLVRGAFEDKRVHFEDEHRVVHPDGTLLWIAASWCVRRDAQGRPHAMAGTVIDITARKLTEQHLHTTLAALENSEKRYRLAMEAAQEGIWDWRIDTGEVDYSPGYALMLGYSQNHFESRIEAWIGLLHPDEAESVVTEARRLLDHPGHYALEFRLRHTDGSYRWILSKGKVIDRDETGKPLRAIGTHIDITQRKTTEERLENSQHLLSLALAGAELGTWDVDIPTGSSGYDERYRSMLGYGADEIEPTMNAWLRLIHPDDLAVVNEAMRAHLAGETRIYEVEYRLRHKAGHWVWVLTRGKVTYDADGQPLRATGTMLDITDRKRVSTEGADLLRKVEAMIVGMDKRAGPSGAQEDEQAMERPRLSPRNRQVLGLIAEGFTSTEIAKRLGISNETAMTHRRNLMRKLGLRNKAELIRYALQHNIGAS